MWTSLRGGFTTLSFHSHHVTVNIALHPAFSASAFAAWFAAMRLHVAAMFRVLAVPYLCGDLITKRSLPNHPVALRYARLGSATLAWCLGLTLPVIEDLQVLSSTTCWPRRNGGIRRRPLIGKLSLSSPLKPMSSR